MNDGISGTAVRCEPSVRLENLVKNYLSGSECIHVLQGINFEAEKGSSVAINGSSGSGKSTLLNIIGCLDKPTVGNYFLEGISVKNLSQNEIASLRNNKFGFVFQDFALLQDYSSLENVILPLIYRNQSYNRSVKIGKKYLQKLGIYDKRNKKPRELSGGQQQKVAIARALASNPSIILADEPTGALDQRTGTDIMGIFRDLNFEGKTVIVVTHDRFISSYCQRVIWISDGRVTDL